MPTTIHIHLNLADALANWRDDQFEGLLKDEDGRSLTAREAKLWMVQQIQAGVVAYPMDPVCSDPCERCGSRFDFAGGGCPGHPTEPQEKDHV